MIAYEIYKVGHGRWDLLGEGWEMRGKEIGWLGLKGTGKKVGKPMELVLWCQKQGMVSVNVVVIVVDLS